MALADTHARRGKESLDPAIRRLMDAGLSVAVEPFDALPDGPSAL